MKKTTQVAEIDWRATLIEALNAPGSLGNTYCRFYNYSFLNQIRLLMQGIQEPVATYRRWAQLGFQVQKGSKAKTVLAPILVSKVVERNGVPVLDEKGQPRKRQVLLGFRDSNTVFGFSDTDGEELPPVVVPEWDSDLALKTLGIKREKFTHTDGNTQGYSYIHPKTGDKAVAINPAAKFPAKTMFHELAHLVLGHADGNDYLTHRGVFEFEAEATAYLLAKEVELDDWVPEESRAYIDGWFGERVWNEETGDAEIENFDKHAARIFSAVNKILVAGRETATEEVAA